jgi:GTP-binding protein
MSSKALSDDLLPFRMRFVQSASDVGTLPQPTAQPCPEICLVGRSNVGKSSLLNRLAGQKNLARVSATPGRTRLINLFEVHVSAKGLPPLEAQEDPTRPQFYLADLPGYGFAEAPAAEKASWQNLMHDYFSQRQNLAAFAFLADVRRTPQAEDRELFRWLTSLNLRPIVVATKGEKVHKSKHMAVRQELALGLGTAPEAVLITSAQTGMGFDGLKWAILEGLDRFA